MDECKPLLRGVQWHVYLADDHGDNAVAAEEGMSEASDCSTQVAGHVDSDVNNNASTAVAAPAASSMPAPPSARGLEPTVSLEVCMTELNREHTERHFVRNDDFTSSQRTTAASGIGALFPTMDIDDYVFEPCGYSMNGIAGRGLHSSTFYFSSNLNRFWHKIHPRHPQYPLTPPKHPLNTPYPTESAQVELQSERL